MKSLRNVWMALMAFLMLSCSMSAKSNDGAEKEGESTVAKGEVVVLNKADFLTKVFDYEKNSQWVYAGEKPCIIDFYADWWGPCRQVAPILRDLAVLDKNDIIIYKVNVDQEKELAAAFGIRSIPTILFIPKKGQPQMSMGALPREEFVKQIDHFLLGK